ncbi:helitron_like_N domain-containing protein [Trichonephila clavata]|uniref:Helitron_like_N domain-containing protein n=1 Tax=Trichonephila clavata TaxID=2740835 RepID=A0A8X6GVC8_TRICU|nr:helitron_like_N domain-containing protein [Trichonephila clavata]
MIHRSCGLHNPHSPCMTDGKCTKNDPCQLLEDTQTAGNGYPLYRRQKSVDGGHTTTVKLNKVDIEIDNQWTVPYSPILLKSFNAHINVEVFNSIKSIKYTYNGQRVYFTKENAFQRAADLQTQR